MRLTVEDIDWKNAVIHFARGKTGEPVALPMGAVAKSILEPARFRGGHVLRDEKGKPMTSERARSHFHLAGSSCEAARSPIRLSVIKSDSMIFSPRMACFGS